MTEITMGEKLSGIDYTDRVGAYVIIIKDGKLATTLAPKGHYLPGGGVKAGETHTQCIMREAMEETGYNIAVGEYITSADKYWKNGEKGYFHPIQYYYSGTLLDKIASSQEWDTDFAWLDLNELDSKMVVDIQVWAVKKWINCTKQSKK